jgi:hypothetical protein
MSKGSTEAEGNHFGGTVLATLAAFAALGPASAVAQVESVTVSKGYAYIQTGVGTVMLDPASNNYSFDADVNGTNISGIAAPTLSGPVNTASLGTQWNGGVLKYSAGDHGWRSGSSANDFGFSTKSILDSAFGNGNYTFTVNGTPVILALTGEAYPNIPIVTLTGGSWANGKYVVDPAQPVTLTTNAFTAYGGKADDRIMLAALQPGFTIPFQEVAPWNCSWLTPVGICQFAGSVPAKTATYTIPANTLVAGQEYMAIASFAKVVDRNGTALPGVTTLAYYQIHTQFTIKAQAPVFPMTVTKDIGPTVSNATANIQFRPQDVGTTGAVYAFFVAPSTKVLNAATMEKSAVLGTRPKGAEKDASVQCVLAQLNSSGQLQAVSASNLQAYVTGVLSGQGQAVTMLNNTLTANIAGSALYVGYGQNALNMLSAGLNRRAVTVPGSVACDPEAPEAGWWWNTAEGGRGYSIEVSGNHIFFASYLYDVSGRATWLVASGNTSLDGSLFTGNLESYANGQTLSGAYRAPGAPGNPGAITLAFNDARHGTMTWPGGSLAIERFNIVPNGLNLEKQANQPESGWWWNPSESGRGYFLEWQGGQLFMAGYMYDDQGNPIWYLGTNTTPNAQSFSGSWAQYGNGQTLTGTYRPASAVNANVAPVTITFQGSENALMTLPGGRSTTIRRFRF